MTKKIQDIIYSLFHKKEKLPHYPLVSVIIPLYNYEKYVLDAINSILKQTYKNWELIIVDDCSTDNSFNVVADYIDKINVPQNIMLLKNERNKGPSATRNNGIKHSKGEYVLYLDADDYVSKYFLEECVKAIIKENADIVYCNLLHFQDAKHKWEFTTPMVYKDYKDPILYYNYILGCSMFSRIAWEKVGGYNENLKGFEDWDFWISCNLAGFKKIAKVNKYLFYYRKHGSSMSDAIITDKKHKELMAQIVLNHKDFYDVLYVRWAEDILSDNQKTIDTVSTNHGGMPLLEDLKKYYKLTNKINSPKENL